MGLGYEPGIAVRLGLDLIMTNDIANPKRTPHQNAGSGDPHVLNILRKVLSIFL
jgi:hypothetical protein